MALDPESSEAIPGSQEEWSALILRVTHTPIRQKERWVLALSSEILREMLTVYEDSLRCGRWSIHKESSIRYFICQCSINRIWLFDNILSKVLVTIWKSFSPGARGHCGLPISNSTKHGAVTFVLGILVTRGNYYEVETLKMCLLQ